VGVAHHQLRVIVEVNPLGDLIMSLAVEPSLHLVEKLRLAEKLARQLAKENPIHAEPRELRGALGSDGSTVHAVLKNWIFDLIEDRSEMFRDLEEAELFVSRTLQEVMLKAFPGACEL
jgi:hypothetical protein